MSPHASDEHSARGAVAQVGSSPELLREQVLAAFRGTPDPRLRELMIAAVEHLHSFAREVALNTHERRSAIQFLTAVGQMCTEVRQEFELLSDVLGLSSLVESAISQDGATTHTLTGPFYAPGRRPFTDNLCPPARATQTRHGPDPSRGSSDRVSFLGGMSR